MFKDIGHGIKSALNNISSLRVFSPDELPGSVVAPAALIMLEEVSYRAEFGDKCDCKFKITILISEASRPACLDRLVAFIETEGENSVPAALEEDPTFGGTCSASILRRNTGFGVTEWASISYLSTDFELDVYL